MARVLWLLLGLGLAAGDAAAQLAVEVRGGAVIGNHLPAAAGMDAIPGPAFGAGLEWRAHPLASVYAAFSRAQFGCEDGFCSGRNVRFSTSGVGAGVRLHPGRLPWLRLGATLYGTEADADGAADRTDAALGFEAGTGLSVPLGRRFRLLPGVYLRSQPGDSRTTLVGVDLGLLAAVGGRDFSGTR